MDGKVFTPVLKATEFCIKSLLVLNCLTAAPWVSEINTGMKHWHVFIQQQLPFETEVHISLMDGHPL